MTFLAYPEYKPSGFDWLPEVPAHWVDRKIARDIPFVVGWTPPSGKDEYYDGDLPWVTIADMTQVSVEDTKSKISRLAVRDKGAKVVPAGSMLFSFKLSVGKVAFLTIDSYTNEAIAGFLPSGPLDLEYWKYAAPEFIPRYGRENIYGATLLNQELISSVRFFAPARAEQTQIARFLDHETARIDALIEEQQRLIELLKEKRRSIALSALSDQSLPLVRIEHVVDVISRPVKQREDESYTPIGLFNRDRGLFHKEPREMRDMGDSDFFWIKSGDLIISGQFAWEGAVAMACEAEDGMVVSHRYPVLRGKREVVNTEYLYAVLTTKHGDFLLNESSRGAAGRNRPLNLAALLKEKIRIPSREIQEHVRTLVLNEAKVLTECRQQISFLQERRSALISAAVTGKIDVRGWQPPASTQAPEPALAVAETN